MALFTYDSFRWKWRSCSFDVSEPSQREKKWCYIIHMHQSISYHQCIQINLQCSNPVQNSTANEKNSIQHNSNCVNRENLLPELMLSVWPIFKAWKYLLRYYLNMRVYRLYIKWYKFLINQACTGQKMDFALQILEEKRLSTW